MFFVLNISRSKMHFKNWIYPVQFLLKFKLKEDFCQRLGYMLFQTAFKRFLSFVSFKMMHVFFRHRARLGTKSKLCVI